MRYITVFLSLILILSSCNSGNDIILGKWNTDSLQYKATYLISKNKAGYDAVILSYNDGTKKINYDALSPYYLFKKLKWSGDKYVDGMSGATKSESSMFTIKIKHKDTIQVTSRLTGTDRSETWTRIKN